MSLEVFLPFLILEQLEKDRYYLCFKYLVEYPWEEYPWEAIWSWTLICWEIFDNWFNFFAGYGSVQAFYFLLSEFWNVWVFRNLSISSRLASLLAYNFS